jgi:hypothetical protein
MTLIFYKMNRIKITVSNDASTGILKETGELRQQRGLFPGHTDIILTSWLGNFFQI